MRGSAKHVLLPVLALWTASGCGGGGRSAGERVPAAGHFARGMWDLSASGSSSIHRADNRDMDRAVSVELSPQCGYFVTDRLEILAAAGADYQDVRYKSKGAPLELDRVRQEDYSAAVGVQYNLDDGSRMIPFLRLYGGAIESRRETVQTNIPLVGTASVDERDTAPYLGGRAGVRCFVTEGLSTDIGLGWKRVFYEDALGGDTDDCSLTIGISIFF